MLKNVFCEPYLLERIVYISPKKSLKNHYNSISLPWSPVISYQTTSLASLTAKLIEPCQWTSEALKRVFCGPRPSWSFCHFFLGVSRSGPRTTSTTNQRSYMALGRLHGPQCEQSLRADLHYGPLSHTMGGGLFSWSGLMVQLPWSESDFLKKTLYKACGPLIRCKPNVDQEERPCTKK